MSVADEFRRMAQNGRNGHALPELTLEEARSPVPTSWELERWSACGETPVDPRRKAAIEKAEPIGPQPVIVNLADVESQPVEWLWQNRIAIGKTTLLVGDPGQGKSFTTLDLTARVTTGAKWPDGCGNAPLGSVVLLSAEDDLADTIRPRLDAAGADVRKVIALQAIRGESEDGQYDRQFDIGHDLRALETAIQPDCRLVVIDPISAYMGKAKGNDNCEVRAVLAPLSEVASRRRVAVLIVSHLRKGDGPAQHRAMGSVAFIAAARAAYVIARDKDDSSGNRRLFLPLKNNLGNDSTGLAFELSTRHSDSSTPCVLWAAETVTTTADEALATPAQHGPKPDSRDEAEQFLRDALAAGPRPVNEVTDEADAVGISERTLKRARGTIGVEAFHPVSPGPWFIRLPEPKGANPASVVPLGPLGSLGPLTPTTTTNYSKSSREESKGAKKAKYASTGEAGPLGGPLGEIATKFGATAFTGDDVNHLLDEAADHQEVSE